MKPFDFLSRKLKSEGMALFMCGFSEMDLEKSNVNRDNIFALNKFILVTLF